MASKKQISKSEIIHEAAEPKGVKRSPDFASLYVNNATFGFTRFDFQMVFGSVEVTKDKDADFVHEMAVIKMTPEFAKALLQDFARVLNDYEQKHGTIIIRAMPELVKQETK